MYELLAQIVDVIGENDSLVSFVANLKQISIIATVILSPIFVFMVYRLRTFLKEAIVENLEEIDFTPPEEGNSPYEARWQEIRKHLDFPSSAQWKLAVIEADALVDDALKSAGFVGESMGDRLMSIEPGQIANIDSLWRAHKLRNRIAHEAGFEISYAESAEAIAAFQNVLRELGGID